MAIGKEVLTDMEKYGCVAGNKCWLRTGREYCGVCKRGDEKTWRKRCDKERAEAGMPPFTDVLAALQTKGAK